LKLLRTTHPVCDNISQTVKVLTRPPDTKRQLQKRIQEEDIDASSSSAAQSGMFPMNGILPYLNTEIELRTVVETYKAKEQSYQERLEAAEIARAKAARGEAYGEDFGTQTFLA
jgi:hypothetical protein